MRKAIRISVVAAVVVALGACGHAMMMMHGTGAEKPATSEFGYGPRTSARGAYVASVRPAEPIRVRRLHRWTLSLADSAGRPVDGAAIEVDGGMPEHGHGLPTRPRVMSQSAAGDYVVDGMKFNMGGWWEVKFRIASPAGPDSVVFNLDL